MQGKQPHCFMRVAAPRKLQNHTMISFLYTKNRVSLWKDLEKNFVPVKEFLVKVIQRKDDKQKIFIHKSETVQKSKDSLTCLTCATGRKKYRENHFGKSE